MTTPAADYFAQFEAPEESRPARYQTTRNKYGWYTGLPDPPGFSFRNGIPNVSTIAGVMPDSYNLNQWKLRQMLIGLKAKPELLDTFDHRLDVTSKDGKDFLDVLAGRVLDAAGSNEGADKGTRFHTYTERVDAGEDPAMVARTMTADEKRMMRAYLRVREEEGLTGAPDMIERIVFNSRLGACGTLDRIAVKTAPDGRAVWMVDDLKTQKSNPTVFDQIKIPVQLAAYAFADYMLDPYEMKWFPMPQVSRVVGTVTWVPSVNPGHAEIFKIDLATGWAMATHSHGVRQYRKRKDVVKSLRKIKV